MNKLISVIVPVYNNEERIERCISSILNQTYKNIELIIINDGSTDKSEEKIKSIADTRIHYVYQNNSGPSIARNNGLDIAKGEYVLFVDSDDFIDSDMLELLSNAAEKYSAEIVSCNIYKKLAENDFREVKEPFKELQTWDEFYINFLLHNGLCSLCNKLIKMSLFHNVRLYEDIHLGEDSSAFLRILPNTTKIAHVDKPLYVYDLTHEGISRHAKKNVYEYMIAITRVLDFYKENKIDLPLPDYFLRLKVCYYTLFFLSLGRARKIEYWDYYKLAEEFHNDFKKIIKDANFWKLDFKFKLFTVVYNFYYFLLYRKWWIKK